MRIYSVITVYERIGNEGMPLIKTHGLFTEEPAAISKLNEIVDADGFELTYSRGYEKIGRDDEYIAFYQITFTDTNSVTAFNPDQTRVIHDAMAHYKRSGAWMNSVTPEYAYAYADKLKGEFK
jgi:hypothetical protein